MACSLKSALKPRKTLASLKSCPTVEENAPLESSTTSSTRVHWTEDHTLSLIKFLAAQKSEAGDGMNFKIGVFRAAAAHFLEPPEGVPKEGWVPPAMTRDSHACKNKWAAVRPYFFKSRISM
jgi:hypothetical protein